MMESPSVDKEVQVVVVIPDVVSGKQAVKCPVLYLLYGYGGHVKTWIQIRPNLPEIADEKGTTFVCSDGKNGWYWNSPENPAYWCETFTSSELAGYIDRNYKTIADHKGRAIAGFSIGGHRTMWFGTRYKDMFGVAESTSGDVNTRPLLQNQSINKQLSEMASNKRVWDEHTVVNQLDKIQDGDLVSIIDCSENDFFLNVSKDSHNRLLGRKINHDFIARPGEHNRKYWNNSIGYQVLFLSKLFAKKQGAGGKEHPGIISATLLPLYVKPEQVWMGHYLTTS